VDHRRQPMDAAYQRGAVIRRLLLDLDAFFLEHPLCGDLSGGTDDERVWMACVACGARIERRVETPQPL